MGASQTQQSVTPLKYWPVNPQQRKTSGNGAKWCFDVCSGSGGRLFTVLLTHPLHFDWLYPGMREIAEHSVLDLCAFLMRPF
jgi:hypothetical protein